jgi:hypothetical protein
MDTRAAGPEAGQPSCAGKGRLSRISGVCWRLVILPLPNWGRIAAVFYTFDND